MQRSTIDHSGVETVDGVAEAFTVVLCGLSSTPSRPEGPPFRCTLIRRATGEWQVIWRCLNTDHTTRAMLPAAGPSATLFDHLFLPIPDPTGHGD